MEEGSVKRVKPDPEKVFSAIAVIVSRRGDGNVRLSAVKSVQRERKTG